MLKKVTIIIPNYNGLKFMEPCMKALETQSDKNFELLVVDNGSTDGSVEWLKEHDIPSIFLKENTGFSGAVNVGIREAKTPYVILLNNDTEPEPDYVRELVRTMDSSKKIFSASSKMIQLYHKDLMDDAGDMYSVLGWAYQRGVGQSIKGYKKPRNVFAACAGAAIYRREVFDEIGGFDEAHFAYLEDIDVGYRAKIYGYDNVYCPSAVVYHVGSGTSGSKYNSFKVKLAARNNIYLNYKNMPFLQLLINLFPIMIGICVKYMFFKKIGFESDYVEGLKEGLKTARTTKKVRFQMSRLKNYVKIEGELIFGTSLYVWEFLRRKLKIDRSY
ncbi:MAG: glycosyltransferase family 2 protein [Clostridiales bacterium]|nr:glycosyltransferase family 2 protein [Clostridiales bacterium]